MRLIMIVFALLGLALPTYAQKIKVRRVKGNQAIVEIQSGHLRNGQTYEVGRDLYTDGAFSPESRLHVFGVAFALSSTKSSSQNENLTSMEGKLRYGWNKGQMEYGVLGSFRYQSEANGTQTFKGGGFFDFNLLPNIPGEIFIYGLGAQALFGQHEANNSSFNLFDIYGTGFIKWFPKGGTVGVRMDAGLVMQSVSGAGSSNTTGLVLEASLIGYF